MIRISLYIFALLLIGILGSFHSNDTVSSCNASYQDSIRNLLLAQKTDTTLKESFLAELYIRGAVNPNGDSLNFNFEFDLHAYDCGAPDCYFNQFIFSIYWNRKEVIFPSEIMVKEFQGGCTEEKTFATRFKKNEANEKHIILFGAAAATSCFRKLSF